MPQNPKVLRGRDAAEAYRMAHAQLYSVPWHKGIPDEHTSLLEKFVDSLEKEGYTSIQTDFELRKTEILNKFRDASDNQCLIDTGIHDNDIYKLRKDLDMLGAPAKFEGVELKETEVGRSLLIDGRTVMTTCVKEHVSMLNSVADCPDNATVFIAGLGLGVVLLYLIKSVKANQIIICEIDSRVISLLGQRITNYFEVPIQIIQGDAFQKIKDLGKFNWIFFDVGSPKQDELDLTDNLEPDGIYTNWTKKIYMPAWR